MGRSAGKRLMKNKAQARTTISAGLTRKQNISARKNLNLPKPEDQFKLPEENRNDFLKKLYKRTDGLDAHCNLQKDDLLDQNSAYSFSERLRFYHELASEAVNKTVFEKMLLGTCQDSGKKVSKPDSKTHAGADVEIDGLAYSLKTEGSKSMKLEELHISKLMEAAWTKQIKNKRDAFEGIEKIKDHLSRYDKIVVLRAFNDEPIVYYQLYEVPKKMIEEGLDKIKTRDFKELTKTGGTRATVKGEDGNPLFDIVYDGSDNKIFLTKIDAKKCDLHAEWWIEAKPDFFE